MPCKICIYFTLLLSFLFYNSFAQETNGYRILNVTFDTLEPDNLQINHGRLIWHDKDLDSGTFNLKYFSGGEIFKLDSNLTGLTSDIDGDFIFWNTSDQQIKMFNTRDWTVRTIGSSYNPDSNQPVVTANGKVAYARTSGSGTEIVLKNLISGEDTTFASGTWNLDPSIGYGQLTWVQKFIADTNISNIYFYDGSTTRNLTNVSIAKNMKPVLKDGQVAWLQFINNSYRVMLFDGDSTLVITETTSNKFISGYDISNGIAVASVTDSSSNNTQITIYNSETQSFIALNDTAQIYGLHIDNGLICWSSGSGVQKKLMIHNISTGITDEWGSALNPVIDDEQIAWTLGDAVSLMIPVTYLQLSGGVENGWPQSRFKANNGTKVIWGNLDNSTTARLFYSDGNTVVQLTDSSVYKDFVTVNDGNAIWRHDFTSLYLYDGVNPPELIIDSLQCENMYVADGSIGFHGFRVDAGNNVNQSWIYRLDTGELIQLTSDDTNTTANTFTLVDGNSACWYRDSSDNSMIMFFDGVNKERLSEFTVTDKFSFIDGKIVWSELINNIFQVILYDVNTHLKKQITNSVNDNYIPITDGKKIVWFETTPAGDLMWYYDIAEDKAHKVVYTTPPVVRWLSLSNGRIAWSSEGEVYVYDGKIISRLTNSAPFNPNLEPYVDEEIVVWNKNNPDPNINHYGQIFRGKLHAHVAFDADKISGDAPFHVQFRNNSFQGVRTYLWDFGDGQTSTEENPVHIYQNPGVYSVTLKVEGPANSLSEKKINLIRVKSLTSVEDVSANLKEFKLYQNYPNPFNPSTRIKFSIATGGFVNLSIFDILGRKVRALINEEKPVGTYEIIFNASGLVSGVYIYRLKAGNFTDSKIFHLIK